MSSDVIQREEATAAPEVWETTPRRPSARKAARPKLAFGLLFFSSNEAEFQGGKYDLVLRASRFADENGFEAVWVPERHFHAVGGLFPNPSVLAGALAVSTQRIRVRAGSVVLPLHHPVRVAEEWSMVDNLSGGRVDLAFARGWNPNDFVLRPDQFSKDNRMLLSLIETVRRLWRGEAVSWNNPLGESVEVRIFPLPKQRELRTWLSCFGNSDRLREAASIDANVLTMLFNQTLTEIGDRVHCYRQARQDVGLDPQAGIYSLMLHTFVHREAGHVRAKIREPFLNYIKGAVNLHAQGAKIQGLEKTDAERQQIAEYAFERYSRTGALFGTPESCLPLLESLVEAGVDEIACQIDFGIDTESVLDGLRYLAELKDRFNRANHSLSAPAPGERGPFPRSPSSEASPTREAIRYVREWRRSHHLDNGDLVRYFGVLDELGHLLLLKALQSMGVFQSAGEAWTAPALRERLEVADRHARLWEALLAMLAQCGLVWRDGSEIRSTDRVVSENVRERLRRLDDLSKELCRRAPELEPQIHLLERSLHNYPDLLPGRIDPMEVLFPGGSMELVEKVYAGNRLSDYFNALVAEALRGCVPARLAREPGGSVRILEVGAGTGATSGRVLETLESLRAPVSYVYTDLSSAFLKHAATRFRGRFPFVEYQPLDIESDPSEQGLGAGGMDVVLASNVLHATRSVRRALKHLARLVRPGGTIVLNEVTRAPDFITLTFGLTSGWWLFEDPELRHDHSPILPVGQWRRLLAEPDWSAAEFFSTTAEASDSSYQTVMIAERNAAAAAPAQTGGAV